MTQYLLMFTMNGTFGYHRHFFEAVDDAEAHVKALNRLDQSCVRGLEYHVVAIREVVGPRKDERKHA